MQSNTVQDVAFADALARAKEIAARINVPAAGSSPSSAVKRPFADSLTGDQPATKKLVTAAESTIDAQLQAIAEQQRTTLSSSAAQAAQLVAARINQQLGAAPATNNAVLPMSLFQMPTGPMTTVEHEIPDKMVGLVIGKEGKQITKLQADTGCKIQIAPDGMGLIMRGCTLTGSVESIQAARAMMQDIIDNAKTATAPIPNTCPMPQEGSVTSEILVSGDKVGLVIGKNGETIKNIQEETGVKMVMIQDSNVPTNVDKPLRFTGAKDQVERAKDMVVTLLKEKGAFPPPNAPGAYPGPHLQDNTIEVPVPREMVGIIIGRGGETIRKIGGEYDVRLQFNPDDHVSPDRVCAITKLNPTSDVQAAANDVRERVENAKLEMSGPRRGPGGGGGGGGRGMDHEMDRPRNDWKQEATLAIPAEKCGIVIGKAGITINEIKSKSGAYVELQRNMQPMDGQKAFTISGTPDQIQIAMEMMKEKAGMLPLGGGGGDRPGPQNMNSPFPPHLTNNQPSGPGFGQGWGDMNMNFQQQQQQQMNQPQRNMSPKPDGTIQYPNFYQKFQQPAGMNQFNQQQQQQAPQQPQQMQQQPQQQQQQPQQQQPQPQARPQMTSQPLINRETGQADYSLQWYEYYMNMAMFNEANMILQQAPHVASALQAKQQQSQQQSQQQQPPPQMQQQPRF